MLITGESFCFHFLLNFPYFSERESEMGDKLLSKCGEKMKEKRPFLHSCEILSRHVKENMLHYVHCTCSFIHTYTCLKQGFYMHAYVYSVRRKGFFGRNWLFSLPDAYFGGFGMLVCLPQFLRPGPSYQNLMGKEARLESESS